MSLLGDIGDTAQKAWPPVKQAAITAWPYVQKFAKRAGGGIYNIGKILANLFKRGASGLIRPWTTKPVINKVYKYKTNTKNKYNIKPSIDASQYDLSNQYDLNANINANQYAESNQYDLRNQSRTMTMALQRQNEDMNQEGPMNQLAPGEGGSNYPQQMLMNENEPGDNNALVRQSQRRQGPQNYKSPFRSMTEIAKKYSNNKFIDQRNVIGNIMQDLMSQFQPPSQKNQHIPHEAFFKQKQNNWAGKVKLSDAKRFNLHNVYGVPAKKKNIFN